jgi:hypothetical protein
MRGKSGKCDSGGDDKGDEKVNKFQGKRTKLFRTKIVEKDESHILDELRILLKSKGVQRTETEGTT